VPESAGRGDIEMHRRSPLRTAWALTTIAGATAVGITTQRPGFVVITFLGGLVLPRVLGFGHHHHGWHGGPWGAGCRRGAAASEAPKETVAA
jgi:hypothetical protein